MSAWGISTDNGSTWAPKTDDSNPFGEMSTTIASVTRAVVPKEEQNFGSQSGGANVYASTMGGDDDEQALVWFMERV